MVALPAITLGLSAIGTAVGVVGALSQGAAASEAADYNKQVAENNARAAEQQTAYAVSQKDLKLRRLIGEQRNAYSASGISGGSQLDVEFDSLLQGEMDKLATTYQGKVEANNYRSQAQLYKMTSQNSRTSSLIQAGGTLLTGAATGIGMYSNMAGSGVKPTFSDMPTLDGYLA